MRTIVILSACCIASPRSRSLNRLSETKGCGRCRTGPSGRLPPERAAGSALSGEGDSRSAISVTVRIRKEQQRIGGTISKAYHALSAETSETSETSGTADSGAGTEPVITPPSRRPPWRPTPSYPGRCPWPACRHRVRWCGPHRRALLRRARNGRFSGQTRAHRSPKCRRP